MKLYDKITISLIFIMTIVLCLSIVSATESTNDTTNVIKEEVSNTPEIVKDTKEIKNEVKTSEITTNAKKINKTKKTDTKTADKTPVNYDIIIRNDIVDNSTIEIGVIDYYTKKAVPNSALTFELPNKSKINAKTLKSGYVNVTMKLPYGKNKVKITYNGTAKYYDYEYDLNLNVVKRNTNMQINVNGSNVTGKVNLTVSLSDTVTGKLLKNEKIQVKISDGRILNQSTGNNGKTLFSFELGNGKQYLNVTYPGSKTYNNSKANLSFTINKGNIKNNANFDIVFKNLYVGKTSFDLTLKDSITQKALPNTSIKIQVKNGKTYTAKTNKTGTLTLKLDVPVGKNYMDVIYAGNKQYNKHTEKINFTVKKRESNLNLTVDTKNDSYRLKVKLVDAVLNKAISNSKVNIKLPNGKNVTAKTDSNGIAYYNINVQEGKKVYKATYAGTANVTSSSYTLTITTPKAKIPVTFNVTVADNIYKNDNIKFILIDTETNKTISNAQLTIKLPQKTVKATTNAKGQVNMQTNMSIGTNNVGLYYAGNSKYANKSANVNIRIDKRPSLINATIKVTDVLSLDLTLTDRITNEGIGHAKIVLTHPKQNITLRTDADGRLLENIVLPAGTAKITTTYLGNSVYNKSNTLFATINIEKSNKTATKVSLNKISGTIGEKVTLKATITDVKGKKINTGTVTFKLNDKTLKTDNTFNSNKATKLVNIKNGTASVTVTADKNMQNIQNFTATYNGNSKYYENISAIVKAQIKSRKAKVVVTTTPTTQDQRKAITFKVKITDITKTKATIPKNNNNSYVYFKINGNTLQDSSSKTVKVKVVNGTATYKYTIPPATAGLTSSKKTKNYVLTAIYCNPNYSTAKNTTTYHVKRSTTRFNITKTTYAKKTGTLTITGKLKDYKNCNVLGTTYVNLKINGQVFKINNKIAEYKVQNGTVNIKIKVPTSIKTIQNVTLTSKDRLAYIYTTATTKKITRV